LVGEITYNPNFNASYLGTGYRYTIGWIPGMNSLGKNQRDNRAARADDIDIKILDSSNNVVEGGHGCWLSHLIIGDQLFWKIEDPLPRWKEYGQL
jgi:hypothetical protein